MYFPDLMAHGLWAIYASAALIFAGVLAFGGKPERYGVLTLVLMLAAQLAILAFTGGERFESLDPAPLVADLIGFVGFTLILLQSRRLWPILAFVLQLLTLLSHLLQASSDLVAYTFVTFNIWPTMLIILLLPVATAAHQWRRRRHGEDPDWVPYRQYARFRKLAHDLETL